MSKKTNTLEKNIMAKVQSGAIVMKPRWYFVLGMALMSAGLIGLSIGAVFLTNLSFFMLRQHGPMGEYRLQLMLESFSWWIPALALAGIGGGVWLLKKYDFSYKKNFSVIIAGFVISILAAAFIMDYSGLNDTWSRGPMRGLYQRLQNPDSGQPLKNGSGQGRGQGRGQGEGRGQMNSHQASPAGALEVSATQLDVQTIEYLQLALADERKARATYEATLEKFGSVKPFSNIIQSEEQHIAQLLALFTRYGIPVPADTTEVSTLPETLAEVCALGVTAEIENDALYQRMIPEIQQADIKAVFTSLAQASKEKHLPAFERCAN